MKLRINEGRWQHIDLSLRICPVCHLGSEDEYHFLLVCEYYNDERLKYLPVFYNKMPNMSKFKMILSCTSEDTLTNVSKFVYDSYTRDKCF